ncbi:MAG: histidinol-phosphatase [Sphingomonadales bacterium]|nr:MAG: histidinol-phosphatase [Sphingomonadales bacterium]
MTEAQLAGLDREAVRSALLDAADAAAERTLAGFRTPLAVENKWETGFDPVTAADKDAEIAVRALIGERFPDHGIIGEEWDPKASSGDFDWIVDPIDGTRAFISGVPVWGTLIGLMHKGRAIAGLMAQPFTGETFIAIGGTGEFHRNGAVTPLRTSGVTTLKAAKVTCTSPDLFVRPGRDYSAAWQRITDATLQTRWGLDCYGYCLLALGTIDLVVEPGLKNVDIAPLIPIIEAAGGVVTTWDGGPAEAGGNCVAAATPELHEAALAALRG